MADNINNIKTLRNIGIDKDLIETAYNETVSKPQPVIRSTSSQGPSIDAGQLQQHILGQVNNQLVDLAKQFTEYSNQVEARIDKLEQQIRTLMKRENQAMFQEDAKQEQQTLQEAPAAQPAQKPRDQTMVSGAGSAKQQFARDDVAIDKMFNFSNTNGTKPQR